jgi:hypothetical protein
MLDGATGDVVRPPRFSIHAMMRSFRRVQRSALPHEETETESDVEPSASETALRQLSEEVRTRLFALPTIEVKVVPSSGPRTEMVSSVSSEPSLEFQPDKSEGGRRHPSRGRRRLTQAERLVLDVNDGVRDGRYWGENAYDAMAELDEFLGLAPAPRRRRREALSEEKGPTEDSARVMITVAGPDLIKQRPPWYRPSVLAPCPPHGSLLHRCVEALPPLVRAAALLGFAGPPSEPV